METAEPTIEVALIAVEAMDAGEEPAAPTKEASDAAAENAIVELRKSERMHAALTPDMVAGSADVAVAAPSELAAPRAVTTWAVLEWPETVPAEVSPRQAEGPSKEQDLSSEASGVEAVVTADEPVVAADEADYRG